MGERDRHAHGPSRPGSGAGWGGAVLALAMAIGLAWGAAPAAATDIGMVYSFADSGKFDKSFNELAHGGLVTAARRHPGLDILEIEPTDGEAGALRAAEQAAIASDLVILLGFTNQPVVEAVAPRFPDTKFTLLDAVVDLPNVQSILFAEEEASFLVGALGAMWSRTGRMGFIGGVDDPSINNFLVGFAQGARHVRPDLVVETSYVGDRAVAFSDPFAGYLLARDLIRGGSDVVFAVAGASGLGTLQAARDHGVHAIGVDANQNYLHPGTMLTSMVKRVDTAVADTIDHLLAETWRAGVRLVGLRDQGVDLAIDSFNRALVDGDMLARIDDLRGQIARGEIAVETTRAHQAPDAD